MANASPPARGETSIRRVLGKLTGRVRLVLFLALSFVLAICVGFSWSTRDAMAHLPFLHGQLSAPVASGEKTLVDLTPWQTAAALAPLAVSSEEIEHAREAERLADHEVDQAFAMALRQASMQRPVLTGEALTLSKRVAQLQEITKADQERVASLTASQAAPKPSPAARAQGTSGADELELAKAQLGLDNDELSDAKLDLARASGDESTRIQQELAAHQAAVSKTQSRAQGQMAVLSARQYSSLFERLRAWISQRSRYELIRQAMSQTQSDAAALTREHDALETQANSAFSPNTRDEAGNTNPASDADAQAKMARIQLGREQRQVLSIYDDRIQTQQQLAAVYAEWSAQVMLQHRILLHLITQQLAWIAAILLSVIGFDGLVSRWTARPGLDRRRRHTLRSVMKVGTQMLGVVLILLVVFGVPRQMPTIVGITTAGLTVVLQDFILAFFGWFVLMGKKGIRVGDSVEINGVGGEVIDISLFRTTLLETGNWTDKGHPTGRRVTFINNFAITGQYFNFSTSGQWMWDEFLLHIPESDDAYGVIERIHKAILKETEEDTRLAEQEWEHAATQHDLRQFSAAPAVDLRPAAPGIDVLVRYVTRASERFATRNRLYQCVLNVLHTPHPELSESERHGFTTA